MLCTSKIKKQTYSVKTKSHSMASLCKTVAAASIFVGGANLAYAQKITVTTDIDEQTQNAQCSLREAVSFINGGKTDSNNDCSVANTNLASTIVLSVDKTYELNSSINISAPMTIESDKVSDIDNMDGRKVATINPLNTNAFVIKKASDNGQDFYVKMKGLKLDATYSANNQADVGGLIHNTQRLHIERSLLQNGKAQKGGAIYSSGATARLTLTEVELKNNQAQQGAAVYTQTPHYAINRSFITQNTVTAIDGFAVYSASPQQTAMPNNLENDYLVPTKARLANAIIFKNNSAAFNLVTSVQANNLSILNNTAGVYAQSTGTSAANNNPNNVKAIGAQLANSVIMGNQNYDVKLQADDKSFINNILLNKQKLLGTLNTAYSSSIFDNRLTESQLLATQQSASQVSCNTDNQTALFCPPTKLNNEFVTTLKPRLLLSYNALSDSPIVDKGLTLLTSDNKNALVCEGNDIRDEKRTNCDLGAFELIVNKKNTASVKEANADVAQGSVANLDLTNAMGDGQLIPANMCSTYITNAPKKAEQWLSGVVGTWTDGCILFVDGQQPRHGKVSLSKTKDSLTFTGKNGYHGTDYFSYSLISTTSRFSESYVDQRIKVTSKVYQYPTSTFENKTINLGYGKSSGGSSSPFTVLALMMMLAILGVSRKK